MISLERSRRLAPCLVGLLASGIVSLPAARAQDAQPPADPNAPAEGASAAPAAGAPSPYAPTIQQPAAPSYKPYLAMPFLGLHSFQNSNSGTGPGLRVGGIAGARVSEQLSLNGELVYDLVNVSNVPSGANVSVYNFQFAVAPFFHAAAAPNIDLLVGPKVGVFHFAESLSGSVGGYTLAGDGTVTGLVAGVNAGGFFRVSDLLSVGLLLNFDWEKPFSCTMSGATDCSTSNLNSEKLISATVGALF